MSWWSITDHIQICKDDDVWDLRLDGAMVYYDGAWYGDWTVLDGAPNDVVEYDEAKSYPPVVELPTVVAGEPCPKCGGLLTTYRGKWAKCTKCEYRGKVQASETAAGTKK